jgi:hypothetical protein
MSKVTGNDGKCCVGVIAVHVRHGHRKSVERIEPVEQVTGRHEVGIRDVDELLHWSLL